MIPGLTPLSPALCRQLRDWAAAHEHLQAAGLAAVPADNPASVLAPELRRLVRQEPGCAVLRGLPIDEFPPDALHVAYAAFAAQLGRIVPQTVSGTLLYSVRDEGVQLARDYGRAGVRTSQTNAAFGFHTDSPAHLAGHTPDALGLLVLETARTGGESALACGRRVYRLLESEHPDALARLCRPFWMDRRAELPPGEPPIVAMPVFQADPFAVRYVRLYIEKGQELAGAPLTREETAALDLFDEAAARVSTMFRLDRGDIQFVNNVTHLHGRTAYEDHPEPGRRRHYLRIWVER